MSRTVIVTGATRGIGRALVDRLVEADCRVIGCGRSRDAVDELRARHAAPHRFDALDVGDAQAVDAWAREVHTPDLLVNNAGVIHRNAPLWELAADELDLVLRVNVSGCANLIRAFAPRMIAAKRGVIVNLSSGWGRSTSPEVAGYCASKWAIEGLSRALAQELPPGLACVALNPGIIDTDMLRSCWADEAGAFPGPEDWSRRAAPFLLGLSARDNGKSLDVPG